MSKGWIKLYRQIQDCWIWEASADEPFSRGCAWIDILLSCNHADKKICFDGKPYTVERGEWLTSLTKLGERWGWGRKKVSSFLDVLEADGMIEQSRNKRRTIIKVLNYGIYQSLDDDEGTTEEHQRNIRGTSEEHQRNINKNDKNVKNVKNERNIERLNIPYFDDPEVNESFEEYIKARKNWKAPMTIRATELAKDKLTKLAVDSDGVFSPTLAVKIINQSIIKNWKSFYELEDNRKWTQPKAKPQTIAEEWEGVDTSD